MVKLFGKFKKITIFLFGQTFTKSESNQQTHIDIPDVTVSYGKPLEFLKNIRTLLTSVHLAC